MIGGQSTCSLNQQVQETSFQLRPIKRNRNNERPNTDSVETYRENRNGNHNDDKSLRRPNFMKPLRTLTGTLHFSSRKRGSQTDLYQAQWTNRIMSLRVQSRARTGAPDISDDGCTRSQPDVVPSRCSEPA